MPLEHSPAEPVPVASRAAAHQPNNTGMPDTLKAGIEHLSGIGMDDVRVHYHSPRPAQLQALAFAQRNIFTPPPVQRYREEGSLKVSENNVFAVNNEGKPDSEMFIHEKVTLPKFDLVDFRTADSADAPRGMKKVGYKLDMPPEKVAAIHCGAFSRQITGKAENVENETAQPGRSLFADNLSWGIGPKQTQIGNWGNHYAPVIVQDDGDRGTFETAVHVDHVWFGIYGQKTGQTFRLKTVVADIKLAVTRKLLDHETANRFLVAIENYKKTGSTKTEDKYLQEELQKIASIVGQTPDIDRKFKEAEIKREVEKKEREEEIAHYWKQFNTENEDTILRELGDMNPSTVEFSILLPLEDLAKEKQMPAILSKITQFKVRFKQHVRDKEKKAGPGTVMSTATTVGIGLGLAVLVGGLAYWLANRKPQ
jgi:hypothetical protein